MSNSTTNMPFFSESEKQEITSPEDISTMPSNSYFEEKEIPAQDFDTGPITNNNYYSHDFPTEHSSDFLL